MASASEKQISYLLQLEGKLTGTAPRYLSQSSVLPKNVTAAEASLLIDELQAAIEAHAKWQAETGLVKGAKIRCTFLRGPDRVPERLAGTVTGHHWSGREVNGLYLDNIDASWEVKGSWFALSRVTEVSPGDDPESLKAERARLLARVADIDAILARA